MKVKNILELDRLTINEFKETKKKPIVLVLDNIRSLNNIGSIFRTADAFLVEAIYLCGITATPPNVEIHKTALGAENSVTWYNYETTKEALQVLYEKGYLLCAVEQATNSIMLDGFEIEDDKKYAIILGNEVKGVSQEVIDGCHCCIEIPQFGTKHSLNVSIAAAIVIWEMFKKML